MQIVTLLHDEMGILFVGAPAAASAWALQEFGVVVSDDLATQGSLSVADSVLEEHGVTWEVWDV